MISGTPEDMVAGKPRLDGYKKALRENGLPVKEENIVFGDFWFDSGKECMERLLNNNQGITAIFVASDEMAAGALSTAYKSGIRVPEDISIIGFDNTQLAEMTIPPLTTVSQPFYQMGYKGLKLLLKAIKGKEVNSAILPHVIVERETVKKSLIMLKWGCYF